MYVESVSMWDLNSHFLEYLFFKKIAYFPPEVILTITYRLLPARFEKTYKVTQ